MLILISGQKPPSAPRLKQQVWLPSYFENSCVPIAYFLCLMQTQLCEWDIKNVDLINYYTGIIKRGCCITEMRSEMQEILYTRWGGEC